MRRLKRGWHSGAASVGCNGTPSSRHAALHIRLRRRPVNSTTVTRLSTGTPTGGGNRGGGQCAGLLQTLTFPPTGHQSGIDPNTSRHLRWNTRTGALTPPPSAQAVIQIERAGMTAPGGAESRSTATGGWRTVRSPLIPGQFSTVDVTGRVGWHARAGHRIDVVYGPGHAYGAFTRAGGAPGAQVPADESLAAAAAGAVPEPTPSPWLLPGREPGVSGTPAAGARCSGSGSVRRPCLVVLQGASRISSMVYPVRPEPNPVGLGRTLSKPTRVSARAGWDVLVTYPRNSGTASFRKQHQRR